MGRSLIPRACRSDTLYGHTCWGNQRYTSTTYSIGDLDERAILPRMSSYRVLRHDYMRTLVPPLNTICDLMCTIPCNPHVTVD